MWGTILSFFGGLLGKVLGGMFGKKGPSDVDLADSNARAQERLGSERAANEILDKASRARGDAVDRVVRRGLNPDSVNSDPDAAINRDPDGHYRD